MLVLFFLVLSLCFLSYNLQLFGNISEELAIRTTLALDIFTLEVDFEGEMRFCASGLSWSQSGTVEILCLKVCLSEHIVLRLFCC